MFILDTFKLIYSFKLDLIFIFMSEKFCSTIDQIIWSFVFYSLLRSILLSDIIIRNLSHWQNSNLWFYPVSSEANSEIETRIEGIEHRSEIQISYEGQSVPIWV